MNEYLDNISDITIPTICIDDDDIDLQMTDGLSSSAMTGK